MNRALSGCDILRIMNLMLARAAKSRPEFAVRAALGARASDLLRIVLAESVGLAASGGVCGVALAWIGRKAFVAMAAGRVALVEQV